MKHYLVNLMILLSSVGVSAQNKVQSVSVEVLGAQNTVGINYDSRFKGNDGLGYRIGVGFGYGNNSSFFEEKLKGVGVPLELNYLLGKNNNKFEMGFGANLGVYHVTTTEAIYHEESPENPMGWVEFYNTSDNRFGYLMFVNVGYRYQRPNGFMFRAGFSPSFNFGDKHGLTKTAAYPYIGFGWSF